LLTWAKEYKVDAFRFDLMGHHMKRNMIAVREALDALTLEEDGVDGSAIYLYGEGWNFGEVADNARGVNATQLNMAGTGIGTFSDRLRDAVRGGGPFDSGDDLVRRQGFANGLFYDPNDLNDASTDEMETLLLLTDQIRVGMAGNLAGYEFVDRNGNLVTGADVDYNGQPAGYTEDPQEDITYVSKHDNQTLYDNNTYKIPLAVSTADRVRVQNVGLSTVLLGQGVPFMHAGSDLLRSKSFDRDSFNSGDWFNKLDFSYQINNYGVGLPVAGVNEDNWYLMGPRLADPALKPTPSDIMQSADLFQELLAMRDSSPLFRLQTAKQVQERVMFHNTGPDQLPGLIVMDIDDGETAVDLDPLFEGIVVLINANDEAQTFTVSELSEHYINLHAVQMDSVDSVVKTSSFDQDTGTFFVPGRTTAVFVYQSAEELIEDLIDQIEDLVDNGVLNKGEGNSLIVKLEQALDQLAKGKAKQAVNALNSFIKEVNAFERSGRLSSEMAAQLIMQAESAIAAIEVENQ
jgi:pullulanase-type alpha-1,6-glucosidase